MDVGGCLLKRLCTRLMDSVYHPRKEGVLMYDLSSCRSIYEWMEAFLSNANLENLCNSRARSLCFRVNSCRITRANNSRYDFHLTRDCARRKLRRLEDLRANPTFLKQRPTHFQPLKMQRVVPQRAHQLWGHAPRVRSFPNRQRKTFTRTFASVSGSEQ